MNIIEALEVKKIKEYLQKENLKKEEIIKYILDNPEAPYNEIRSNNKTYYFTLYSNKEKFMLEISAHSKINHKRDIFFFCIKGNETKITDNSEFSIKNWDKISNPTIL